MIEEPAQEERERRKKFLALLLSFLGALALILFLTRSTWGFS